MSASNYKGQLHEHDDRWTAVDNYTYSHLHGSTATTPSNDVLQYTIGNTEKQGLPDIAVSPAQGKFLMLQARMIGANQILEVGTLGGYSTIWLANTRPDVKVTTVEVNQHHADVARQNFEKAGVSDRIEIIVGSGRDILPKLAEEVKDGKRAKYNMAFIDADKENNWFYFDTAVPMMVPRGAVFIDNVVRKGTTANEEAAKTDSRIQGARRAIENVGKDGRVDAIVLQTVGEKSYDGFLLAIVRHGSE